MADEFARIDEILRRLRSDASYVTVPNGDDAAALRIDGETVLSIDAAVEGTHFELAWLTSRAVGYRAAVAALSDLAAMGAQPRAMLSSVIAPSSFAPSALYEIADGYAEAATEYAAPVIGGNLSSGEQLSLTTTVVGSLQRAGLQRSGARPNDVLYVTGTLGAAALGLACLQRHANDSAAQHFISRWQRPVARVREGLACVALATAAIDLSDGLLQDVRHLCRASRVGIVIHAECLPMDREHLSCAQRLGLDALALALAGGEDYELLFTMPASVAPPIACTAIGHITSDMETRVLHHGTPIDVSSVQGFRHFT